jgi:cytochrome bd ubiquinol oxidase subunit II
MELAWFALLGTLFAGYLVLGGYDYGVGLLLAGEPDPAKRRTALTAVGPFFLGNEVWLVVTVGVLFGAFPRLEGELLAGFYPAIVVALMGVVLVTASVQLRSRPATAPARARWDRLIIAGSALAALGWGAFAGGVVQGHDADAHPIAQMLTPFVAACALALVALVALHGATFLALRMPAGLTAKPVAAAKRLVPAVVAAVALATVIGTLTARVRQNAPPAVLAVLGVLVVLVLLAGRLADRRPGWAFVVTSAAMAAPVLAVGLVLGGDVASVAAPPETLRLLSWVAVPIVPVLIGFQAMSWWIFRGRVDGRTPVYW